MAFNGFHMLFHLKSHGRRCGKAAKLASSRALRNVYREVAVEDLISLQRCRNEKPREQIEASNVTFQPQERSTLCNYSK